MEQVPGCEQRGSLRAAPQCPPETVFVRRTGGARSECLRAGELVTAGWKRGNKTRDRQPRVLTGQQLLRGTLERAERLSRIPGKRR
ncbi:unnamed protein product [Rangifer tarandus platyrhynchus]|uniref:Uncharacterized protein n=1 Tax=Rangifer tarandus platyrhynchus TaxID=3082113 RepID=A0AC59ZMF1_RANTA